MAVVNRPPERVDTGRQAAWWAVVSAGLAPVLLIGAWVIAETAQPASYSPARQTVSVLAGYAGTDRWIMTTGLIVVGCCHLVTGAGLTGARTRARAALMLAGVASIGIALSPEPAHEASLRHLALTVLAAAAITIWPLLAARAPPPLALSGPACAAVTAVLIVLLCWLLIESQGGSDLGLAERLTTGAQTFWPFPVAIALFRTGRDLRLCPDSQGGTGVITDRCRGT